MRLFVGFGVAVLALMLASSAAAFKVRCCFAVQVTASGTFTEDHGNDIEANKAAGSLTHEWRWAWRDLYGYEEHEGEPVLDNIEPRGNGKRLTRFKVDYSVRARLWAYGEWYPECRFESHRPEDGTGWMRPGRASGGFTGDASLVRNDGRIALVVRSPDIAWTRYCPNPYGSAIYTVGEYFGKKNWGPSGYEITPPKRAQFRKGKRFGGTYSASAQCFDQCEGIYTYVRISGNTKVSVSFTYFSISSLQDWIRKLNRLPE